MIRLSRYCSVIILSLILSSCHTASDNNTGLVDDSHLKSLPTSKSKVEQNTIPLLSIPYQEPTYQRSIGKIKRGKRLNIALLVPLSGPESDIGRGMLDAVQMAANDLGAGYINLIAVDTGIDAESANAALNKLEERIDIIIGPIVDGQLSAIYTYAKSRSIIVLSLAGNNKWVGNDGLYLLGVNQLQRVNMLLSYASIYGYTNIYSLVPKDDFGNAIESLLLKYKERNLISNYHVIRYDENQSDNVFGPAIQLLREKLALEDLSQNKSIILLPQFGTDFRRLIQQISVTNDINVKKLQVAGGSFIDDDKLQTVGWNSDVFFADPPLASRKDFNANFKNTYKDHFVSSQLLARISLAYDALALILTNIETNGENIIFNPQNMLNKEGFEGVNGIFRLRTNGSNERLLSIFKLHKNGQIDEVEIANTNFKD